MSIFFNILVGLLNYINTSGGNTNNYGGRLSRPISILTIYVMAGVNPCSLLRLEIFI